MTKQQSFKRRIRDRMDKTNESYTAARRQLLAKAAGKTAPAENPAPSRSGAGLATTSAEDQPARSGVSAQRVRQRTGRDWDEWFALLDGWDARGRKHPEIARWLVAEHDIDGWWAQSITVGYEQARGIRVPGQRSDGTFSTTASKTVAVPVERIFEAWTDERLREGWLPGVRLTIRTAREATSLSADWEDGSTRLAVGFSAKGADKGQVAMEHQRLPDGEKATEMKVYWRERMAALKSLLEGDS